MIKMALTEIYVPWWALMVILVLTYTGIVLFLKWLGFGEGTEEEGS